MAQAMGSHEGTEQPRKGQKKRRFFRPCRGYSIATCVYPQLALWATLYRP